MNTSGTDHVHRAPGANRDLFPDHTVWTSLLDQRPTTSRRYPLEVVRARARPLMRRALELDEPLFDPV